MNHNVADYGQLPDGDFAMHSDEQGDFTFRPCAMDVKNGVDVAGILAQGVGYIADRASWEERGTCKSILRADLGFHWRDQNFDYRRISDVNHP